jgi:uncharacterized protein (DUF1697 family)
MKFVAFFRNLNLGRPNCPNKAQLEHAFLSAGANFAVSFLTNGTLVFDASGPARARKTLALACAQMAQVCGLKEPAFLRSVDELAKRVAQQPFAGVAPGSVYACCVTFLPPKAGLPAAMSRRSTRRDLEILLDDGSDVFSLCHKIGNTPGSPNAFLEKALAVPATTRNWNTVMRLVEKHA